jgi:hypothetical protein
MLIVLLTEIDQREQEQSANDEQRSIINSQSLFDPDSQYDFNQALNYQKQLNTAYEHLQQQLQLCSTKLDKKRLVQEQIQLNIEQIHHDIDDIQTKNTKNRHVRENIENIDE